MKKNQKSQLPKPNPKLNPIVDEVPIGRLRLNGRQSIIKARAIDGTIVNWDRVASGRESLGDWWEVRVHSGEKKGRCCWIGEAAENGVACWSFNGNCPWNACGGSESDG